MAHLHQGCQPGKTRISKKEFEPSRARKSCGGLATVETMSFIERDGEGLVLNLAISEWITFPGCNHRAARIFTGLRNS